jgi:lipid-A-disaccharide synthase
MKKILIIAGEASGDLHGANLVRAIRARDASVTFFGVGSRNMREAGVEMLADAAEISVVGATEVITHLGAIYGVYAKVKRFLREERPDLLILIDFPDFNILTGKAANRIGVPVLYYISPQVWAWRKGRVRTIAKLVKTIMVIFPFEKELYEKVGADVRFVGHPLADVVRSGISPQEARARFCLREEGRVIALLPGSRKKELYHLLPDMLRAAALLKERYPDLQFVLPVAPTLPPELVADFVRDSGVEVRVVDGQVYDVLRSSHAAIVASGTATLETGLMSVPMVIVYRVSRLSYIIGRMIVRVRNIGLVNIVAGRTVVPELVQDDVTPENIVREMAKVLDDPARYAAVRADLLGVRASLGDGGASERAASVVLEALGGAA